MLSFNQKIWYLITQTIYALTFGKIGKRCLVYKPLQLDGRKAIYLEDDVYIAQGAWLKAKGKEKTLWIERGSTIGHFSHIIAWKSVTIGSNVLIADKVFISDCSHRYEDIDIPIKKQGIKILSPVSIGEDSWIGENVCVCGASIGKHCIIGANSVVLSDIPDYCVAAGAPAKVVKRFDTEKNEWEKVINE